MIDFSNVKSIVIPEGEVAVIARGSEILWEKQVKKYMTELAYLESTGTQWIDSLIEVGSFVPSIKIKFRSTTYGSGAYKGYYVGIMNNGSRGLGITKSAANTVLTHDYDRMSTTVEVDPSAEWNEVFVNRIDKTVTADGTTVPLNGSFYWAIANTGPLALFGTMNFKGGIYGVTKSAIAYCQMFDNEFNLIADFIPVLDWNNVPCMYDKVTDDLFYNQGTGEFLYG